MRTYSAAKQKRKRRSAAEQAHGVIRQAQTAARTAEVDVTVVHILSALLISTFDMITRAIITKLITLPTPYISWVNFKLIESPKSVIILSDNSSLIAKVDIVGINTIVIPLIIPGMESGKVVLVNTPIASAPKSCAASLYDLSIPDILV